jgi:CheY-like chemotaxis protein
MDRDDTARGNVARVLYVEDEDLNWHITARRLRESCAITRAKNAHEVFACLAEQHFDLVLMDIALSGSELDGIQITRIIKGTYPDPPAYATPPPNGDKLPIVFVTAYASRYTRSSLISVGGTDVIYKPVNFGMLTACISRILLRERFRTSRHSTEGD